MRLLLTLFFLLFLALPISPQQCTDPNCISCPSAPQTCSQCKLLYYLSNNICTLCSSSLPNCQNCTFNTTTQLPVCTSCAKKYSLNDTNNQCVSCGSVTNCTDCQVTKGVLRCIGCEQNTVLNVTSGTCLQCSQALFNCTICNDSFVPISCVSCAENYYSSYPEATQCLSCSTLITDCTLCQFQAPFEQAKCNTCKEDLEPSQDKYTCEKPLNVGMIVGIVIGVVVVAAAVGVGVWWFKKKKHKKEEPLHDDIDSYERA